MVDSREDLDELIVNALRAEPRASFLALARKTGFPRAVISARVTELIDSRDLRIVAALHPQASGHTVIAHVSVDVDGPVSPVVEGIRDHEECVFISIVAGAYDFVMEVRVRSHDELHALLADVRSRTGVLRINTVIYSSVFKGNLEHTRLTQVTTDEIDRDLIGLLQRNGRMSWQELADTVALSSSAVRSRVNRLLDSGLVQLIVLQQRGRFGQGVTSGVGLTLRADAATVLPALATEPFVEFAVAAVGRFDAVLTVRAASPAQLHDVFEQLRSLPEVAHLETWAHLKSVKEDYTRRL